MGKQIELTPENEASLKCYKKGCHYKASWFSDDTLVVNHLLRRVFNALGYGSDCKEE